MSKKGGYVIVDLKGQSITAGTPFTLDGVTARLNRAKNKACLLSGFAIGNDEKRDVFVDLQKTEDGYVALFGQYTITIENDEVTITDGGILLDNIVDSQGNKRFVEGEAITNTVTGVTFTYNKWSLSGTHLMIVLAGSISEGTYSVGTELANIKVPDYVYNKITPISGVAVAIDNAQIFTSTSGGSQALVARLLKRNEGYLSIDILGRTVDNEGTFRIKYDILIDTVE